MIHKEDGVVVSFLDNIAYLGGAALDNEECHLKPKVIPSRTWIIVHRKPPGPNMTQFNGCRFLHLHSVVEQ